MPAIQTPCSRCEFGIARAAITPPVGIYHRMWGAARHERATGVHRPLTATALVFRAADAEQVLVAVDHCLLWAREMEELLREAARQSDTPTERLVIVFSHTHAAGLMDRSRSHLPGGELIGPYLDSLAATLGRLVLDARAGARPATITYGTGRCGLAAPRDFWDEQTRQFVCGFNPDGATDETLLVTRVTGQDGEFLATVVNYACHPTTLAFDNTLISPDYPGAMRELIEHATGAPCVFLQGASGDLGPREGYVADVAVADRNGRQLGHAALAALEALPPGGTEFVYRGPLVSGATLGLWDHVPLGKEALRRRQVWRCRRWTVPLPYRGDLPDLAATRAERDRWAAEETAVRERGDTGRAGECRARIERMDRQLTRLSALPPGPTFPLPVVLWQMGDAFWVAVECEHYNLLQRALRERFPGTPIVVLTLANGTRAAYLPTKDTYGKGIYQETIAVLAPGSLEQLIEAISQELHSWWKEYRNEPGTPSA